MQAKSDAELLREHAGQASEAAFREIVTRHADLVYASALRQVRSPELARDITQGVFADLVRKAPSLGQNLAESASLVGWLYRSTRYAAHTQLRNDRRRQARERQAMENFAPTSDTATDWEQIGPVLDEAMADLSDEDREALLLRYFKNHDFRAIGVALGVSDDAAQKRVSRALERLRAEFNRRGVSISAGALAAAVSANAVTVGPAGLAAALSTAALTGTTLTTAATVTATKAIVMTTLQKTLITATLAIGVGAGIYEARQASRLRDELQTLRLKQAEQARQFMRERDESATKLAGLHKENERLNGSTAELLKLRGEVARLRMDALELAQSKVNTLSSGEEVALKSWLSRVKEFKRLPERMPGKTIPELRLLTEDDWLELAKEPLGSDPKDVNLDDDEVARLAFSAVRAKAKDKLMRVFSRALEGYANANSGQLATDTSQLKPYLMNPHFLGPARVVQIPESAVDDTVFRRYEILQTGKLEDVAEDLTILAERAPVDSEYDTCLRVGRSWMAVSGLEAYAPEKRARSE